MREYVNNHKEYQKNSIINQKIAYDLNLEMINITKGKHDDCNFS